ncbi:MAG: vitamin B12-dependent ribonucleotide reductase [Candidatus Eisenbacteria bacterium]|nr:vitamin B12-dependent ribonucleotide reductase [Candidatus Eisenbacteria bacterium]
MSLSLNPETHAPTAAPGGEPPTNAGLHVPRRFSVPGVHPFDAVKWDRRRTVITNPDGSVVFQADDVEVPAEWSQLATDIVVSKYFRRAGVPGHPGRETSVRQVVNRLVRTIRASGEQQGGYFAGPEDAEAFEAELAYMLVHQIGAFNSPVWFNCGLFHEYGISGSGGSFAVDLAADTVRMTTDSYSRPQVSACFIQSCDDDLMSIFELVKNEARVFKYGSGTGTNFSKLRGRMEKLSGGGTSSGLMSFLEVLDRGAGATKSGGTTRRAAKMVVLDVDHPEITEFVRWKMREEKKVAALISAGYPSDFNGEAYATVSGQNSNNSVRVPDTFMRAVETGGDWQTTFRTTGQVHETMPARRLWDDIATAAWSCADPGVQYDDTIQKWHTCKATDRIHATNPCVTGDTLVATSEGWKRIDSLVGKSARVMGADGQPHWVTDIFPTGHKPVFRLRTKAGYEVTLTADHKVWTLERGDVPVSGLVPGDLLALQGPGFGRRALGKRLGLAIGVAVGDGCLARAVHGERTTESVILTMSAEEAGVLEAIAGTVNEAKRELRAVNAVGRADDVRVAASGARGTVSRLAFGSRPVVDLFKEFAVLDEGSQGKRFTPAAFDLDRASLAAVLRGLFTADGTVANHGEKSQYVSLDSSSHELLRQVQALLLGFGIKAKLYENRRGGTTEAMLPDGRGGSRSFPVTEMHSLRISRSSRVLFEREIGFDPASPKATALAELNDRFEAYLDDLTDAVASVTPAGEADVYDLTEPVTSHFVANGMVVHNCSEFVFLDDTACNLASVNLMKFRRDDGSFDIEGYRHANRVFFLAQEILVSFASYPTERIARNSEDYRPLGLGYANLGTLLMVEGLPYDSDAARAYAGCITAMMTGEAYALSAEMAASKGPFRGYARNADSMLGVMRLHREAARAIDPTHAPRDMRQAAIECWDRAVAYGGLHGYRNAQATVLAPTGTIGLLMDCDTTGVEPDFALVKFKKLAGGGYFKIVNQSVPLALERLGYDAKEIERIIRHAVGHGSLDGAPHINASSLLHKGFSDGLVASIEALLPNVLDIRQAFGRGILSDEALTNLGVAMAEREKPGFNVLPFLGFTDAQIEEANLHVCGSQTVEGAPGLKSEHFAVFDCANRCGAHGTRFIQPMGHVRMMSAVQPFISGAISKTVNLPNDATVDEVRDIYSESWKLGIKAVALYRDGCKMSQPLSTAKKKTEPEAAGQPLADEGPAKLHRRRLPKRRHGFTQEARIAGHKVFLRTGEYEDGTIGEIFIDMHKEGAAFRSMMNCFAIAVSMGLQYGVPLEDLVDQFCFTRFEPHGRVEGHDNIKVSTSVIDYVFRVLGFEYLNRTDLAHVIETAPSGEVLQPRQHAVDVPVGREHRVTRAPAGPAGGAGAPRPVRAAEHAGEVTTVAMQEATRKFKGDAPACDNCGHITIRNGTCYKCVNCGNSQGCS